MGETSENKPDIHKKHICAGIVAHVDAGKTTLSEALLYLSGSIRSLGRVDHQDAFLDTFALERARGITIFSKQAELSLPGMDMTLLDTPGHVDFAAEMERTLQVLDYAILVISGADGVQGHTETLWRLLSQYRVPVFVFINKMDQPGTDQDALMGELQHRLDGNCIWFGADKEDEVFLESLAMCDEVVMERYLETGEISREEIVRLIAERKAFPCFFGSALKLTGVEEFIQGFSDYTAGCSYPQEFGAKVYKISRDAQGKRLTHMKITGGSLKAKTVLTNRKTDERMQEQPAVGEIWEEKADQIRIYSGAKFETVTEVPAGTVCAVTGLTKTWPGQGLGIESASESPILEPVLTYRIELPEGCDVHGMLQKLRQLEEEEPELHIVWNEQLGEIHVQVMGEVQIEILQSMILEQYGTAVTFGTGNIVYKETILEPVEGAGHFEPLRHYAEVHLLMEPGERGSGIQVESACSVDALSLNWQRLILTHLLEKEHVGVLAGVPVTDIRITLTAGRAHLKHTEGGDFRQATYRAVRQGLKKAKSILLEPYYAFRLEIPSEMTGRALTDIQRMSGRFDTPETEGDMTVLTGAAPVSEMRGYQMEVSAYTRGRGRLFCTLKGYEPCHNAEEIVLAKGYDSERDLDNPTGSVFCSHGAGFVVSWDLADEYMHVASGVDLEAEDEFWDNDMTDDEAETGNVHGSYALKGIGKTGNNGEIADTVSNGSAMHVNSGGRRTASAPVLGVPSTGIGYADRFHDEDELKAIFERTYGTSEKDSRNQWKRKTGSQAGLTSGNGNYGKKRETITEYLLVDGYNIIFAWDELKELADDDIGAARTKLMDILCNYQGFTKCRLILVFDAYRVEGHPGEVLKYHNIYVVYTKEAETADQYIEKTVREIGRKYHVTVATSDRLEQVIILGEGARRLSASDLKEEIAYVEGQIRNTYQEKKMSGRTYLFDSLDDELAEYMEDVRLGRKKME